MKRGKERKKKMQFEYAIWLVAGLAACTFLGFAFVHFHKKGQVALQQFAAGRLLEQLTQNVSTRRRQIEEGSYPDGGGRSFCGPGPTAGWF